MAALAGTPGSPTLWVLAVVLLADVAFVQLHRLHLQGYLDSRFSLEVERSASEYYQHGKELLAAILAALLYARRRDALYLCWAGLFGYLLLDDALQVHERIGALMAAQWLPTQVLSLEARFVAELVVSGSAGLAFLVALAASWRHGTPGGQGLSIRLLAALAVLAAFGVAADALHSIVTSNPWHYRLGMLEDGGELLAMSVILWLVFTHATVGGGSAVPS